MTREEYLMYRAANNFPTTMLYEYYTIHCESNCISHDQFVDILRTGIKKFVGINAMNNQPHYENVPLNVQKMAQICVEYFDAVFNLVTFMDKNGTLIKYL